MDFLDKPLTLDFFFFNWTKKNVLVGMTPQGDQSDGWNSVASDSAKTTCS